MRADCVRRLCGAMLAAFLLGGVPRSLCSGQVAVANNSSAEVPLVKAVRVVTVGGEVLKVGDGILSVELDKPLDLEKVAASLKSLYRTGDYSDIQAVAEPVDGGTQINFIVQENLFFNQLIVLGLKSPPSEASAAAAMQITLGDPFRQEILNEAVERLKTRLQEEGLYTAKVDIELRPHPAEHQMDIVVRVQSGPRVRVGAIHL